MEIDEDGTHRGEPFFRMPEKKKSPAQARMYCPAGHYIREVFANRKEYYRNKCVECCGKLSEENNA